MKTYVPAFIDFVLSFHYQYLETVHQKKDHVRLSGSNWEEFYLKSAGKSVVEYRQIPPEANNDWDDDCNILACDIRAVSFLVRDPKTKEEFVYRIYTRRKDAETWVFHFVEWTDTDGALRRRAN
jgi:hypothetical protein